MAVFVIINFNSAQPLPNPPNIHRWRVLTRETYDRHNTVIGTLDCPLEGCWTKIEIPLHINSTPSPFLFFPYNTGEGLHIWRLQIFGDTKSNPPQSWWHHVRQP
ncbi:mCG144620, isoform CRA_a [Mus musculus]|uniref:Uncharacterized protein n=1 Tax=Mus musculus TaxID=10090 RepID=Q8C4Y8_MOUSE|nr:mCG144620, isoform CRA_a [Mus musculus]BAC37901.1 unnamed protein product [Mus musculus]